MSVNLCDVYRSDYNKVLPLLMRFSDPAIGPAHWKCLFNYDWEGSREQRGIALVDDGMVVGFVGTIFSTRNIKGVSHSVCNFSGGIVLDEYRAHSLKLLVKAFTVDADILLDLTPVNSIVKLLQRLEYKKLEESLYLSYCTSNRSNQLEVYFDRGDILKQLHGEDLRNYLDHCGMDGEVVVFKYRDKVCSVYYRLVTQDLPYDELSLFQKITLTGMRGLGNARDITIHVQHVSDVGFFTDNLSEIRTKISSYIGVKPFLVESRFVAEVPRGFFRYSLENPRMFKSKKNILPSDVSHLYTETFLMGVSAQSKLGTGNNPRVTDYDKKLLEMREESLRLTKIIDGLDSDIVMLHNSINGVA